MDWIKSICVYCGGSQDANPKFYEAAAAFGKILAQNNIRLVYGGAQVGMMGAIANAALEGGGEVLGITPNHLEEMQPAHKGLSELIFVPDMHTRKRTMFENSDAFVVLPGGFGTLDEVFEIITWKQIKLHDKQVVFLNLEGYWEPIKSLAQELLKEKFIKESDLKYFDFVEKPEDILPLLGSCSKPEFPDQTDKF